MLRGLCLAARQHSRLRGPILRRTINTSTLALAGGAPHEAGAGAEQHRAPPPPPSPALLLHDAQLARLSGLCYLRPVAQPDTASTEDLQQQLSAAGFTLVAEGRSWCTQWFCVDRAVPANPPPPGAAAPAAQPSSSAAAGDRSVAEQPSGSGAGAGPSSATAAAAVPPRERMLFIRGVSWSAADLDTLRVWRHLVQAWPAPFLPELTRPRGALVAHAGVAEMAAELWGDVSPLLAAAPGAVSLAGHSLGGSLSLLLACRAQLELGVPGARLSCATFGSPPVLSLARGADGGDGIVRALGMAPGSVRNYVLADDPVPRALLSADPAFEALKANPAVSGLLALRERVLGAGSILSPDRFLFHSVRARGVLAATWVLAAVGAVYLLRWSPEEGYGIRRLSGGQLADELRLDVAALRQEPMRLVQALLDHHHGSCERATPGGAVLGSF
eukprot:scaffold8.g1436.t1